MNNIKMISVMRRELEWVSDKAADRELRLWSKGYYMKLRHACSPGEMISVEKAIEWGGHDARDVIMYHAQVSWHISAGMDGSRRQRENIS